MSADASGVSGTPTFFVNGRRRLQIPTVHRTLELRFRSLLTEGATWQVEVVKA
jgi:hypothetical protein